MQAGLKASLITIQIGLLALAGGCGERRAAKPSAVNENPIGLPVEIRAPLGLPPVPVPKNNPVTAEAVALGRRLFYEKRLSGDTSLACSSCHNPLLAFADDRARSSGAGGKLGARNAPTVINAAYVSAQFWDGRAPSLEEQAGGPIANPIEMNQTHEVSVSILESDSTYKADFEKAFGPGPVTIGKVKNAIASFERTLLSGNSPFDRYQFGGDKKALSPAAVRGLAIFLDPTKGNCATCHTVSDGYALFTDGKFHNIGVGVNGEGDLTDLGRFGESKTSEDEGSFKTPSLRSVAKTAPYMHDGSLKTLEDVVAFYVGGGNSNPHLDKEIRSIQLSAQEKADLIAFLESLTGTPPPDAGPPGTTLREPK